MVIIDMSFSFDNLLITDYFVLPANVYETFGGKTI